MSSILVKFMKLSPDAVTPKSNVGDVGFDITSIEDVIILPGNVARIKTGIALADSVKHFSVYEYGAGYNSSTAIPFFKIEGRSGLASLGVFPVGGIIDPTYRGEIQVLLFNSTHNQFVIKKGMRIAQLVCYLTLSNTEGLVVMFDEVANTVNTVRGDKGFGSSGV